jgi:hypothetical protein
MAELDPAVTREWLSAEHRDYRSTPLGAPNADGYDSCACGNPEPCYERENVLALLAEVERLRTLLRTVELTGTGFVYRDPSNGEERLLSPQDVMVVISADQLTEQERLTAEVERLRAELKEIKGNRLISAVFGHHKGAPRPFALFRRPATAISSGVDLVALGAEFPDGAVALRLANDGGWTTRSEDGADALAADTDTEIVWLSDELEPLAETEQKLDAALAEIERLTAEDRSWADTP